MGILTHKHSQHTLYSTHAVLYLHSNFKALRFSHLQMLKLFLDLIFQTCVFDFYWDMCNATFAEKGNLNKHIASVHKEMKP